jgi:nitrite reductase/ring-hydroxylating ferredoxin subunit
VIKGVLMADDITMICSISRLMENGKGVRFNVSIGGKPRSAFAIRFNCKVFAFLNCCPHLGTELDWQPGEFFDVSGLYLVCATHGALFMPDSGYCIAGPCKRQQLVRLPVMEREDAIFLDEGFTLYVE